ncbi:MAG: AgmX/PglI C-terminal domain-containing protein, partial [Deltaproteobacteria bacterium]|nr:AgmX/PglI C-terminal domain-containing protein [Deltaproteobacteria bacterium]
RLSSLISLTEKGQKIFKAGQALAVSPFRINPGRYFLTLWSRLDLNAMLQAASPPAALAEVKKLGELTEALMECGAFCSFHYLVRNPFGLARTLLDLIPQNFSGQLPHSLNLAILAIDPQNRKAPIRLAAAAHFPLAASTRLLRQGLAELDREPGTEIRSQLYVEPVGQNQVVRLGLGSDPRDVFDLQILKPPVGTIGELSLDPSTLANLVNHKNPKAAAILDQLGQVHGRVSYAERAIAGEIILNIKGQKKQVHNRPANFSGLDWDSPGAAAAGTKGAKCMQAVTREMIRGFGSLAMAAPDMRSLLLSRLIEEVDKPLSCARQAKDTSESARRTQLMLALYVADRLAEDYHIEAEKLVLGRACNQGHSQACNRIQAIKARPSIRLAQVDTDCKFGHVGGRPFIRIPKASLSAELPAFDQVLSVGNPAPTLVIDRDTKYARIAKVLGRVAQDREKTQVLIETKDQQNQAVHVNLLTSQKQTETARHKRIKEKMAMTGILGAIHKDLDKSDPLIVLKVRGPKVDLAANGTWLTFEGTQECPTETSCRTTADLNKELAEQRKLLGPNTKTYLDADPETTFKQLAPILVLAACATDQGQYGQNQEPPVIFGPVPDELFERAKSAPAPDRKGAGLAIGGKLKKEILIGGGSLPKEIILGVIRKNVNVVRYCFEKELIKNPGLSGKVIVQFTISPSGRVQQAKVKSSTLNNKTM